MSELIKFYSPIMETQIEEESKELDDPVMRSEIRVAVKDSA